MTTDPANFLTSTEPAFTSNDPMIGAGVVAQSVAVSVQTQPQTQAETQAQTQEQTQAQMKNDQMTRAQGRLGSLVRSTLKTESSDGSRSEAELGAMDLHPSSLSRRKLVGATVASIGALATGWRPPLAAASEKPTAWGVGAGPTEVPKSDAGKSVIPTPPPPPPSTEPPTPSYNEIIERVVNMPFDNDLTSRAREVGLDVLNVTWEDTGRNLGSVWGPNISDLTLQVREPLGAGQARTHLLPVMRFPNYEDQTGDVPIEKIWIKVGNQSNRSSVVAVPLKEVLTNMRSYLSKPGDLKGSGNFFAARDTHILTSAQHVFMPLPKTGKTEFTPVIYNYVSSKDNPAVMVLMVTRQGTSATIIENWSGDQSYQQWGQQLYFNNKGQRTVLTAERKSAVKKRVDGGQATSGDEGALDEGSDMIMLIQIPLVHRDDTVLYGSEAAPAPAAAAATADAPAGSVKNKSASTDRSRETSDVEAAVIGKGEDLGPFRETAGMPLVRDERFPIRVTVQFYKATSNGIVNASDLRSMRADIDRVYANADYVGSLVVPQDQRPRPTAWVRGRTPIR